MKDYLNLGVIAALVSLLGYLIIFDIGPEGETSKRVDANERKLDDLKSKVDEVEGHVASKLDELLGKCCCKAPISCPEPLAVVQSNFTLLYENARLDLNRKLTPENVGIKLTQGHKNQLDRIVKAFSACAQPSKHVVQFEVVGYSSTAEFQFEMNDGGSVPMQDSKKLNVDAANLRAELVVGYLRKQEGFEVKLINPSKSHDGIDRPYLDDSETFVGRAQEALNRSVLIKVVNAGACDKRRQQESQAKF